MKIVSENTDADLATNRAEQGVNATLRSLTANLIRIARGAGRPEDIAREAFALAEALVAYEAAAGMLPFGQDLAAFIQPEESDPSQWSDEEQLRHFAQELVVNGALQLTASRILGQRTQAAAGRTEMHTGMREIEAMRAAVQQQRKAEDRALRAATRKAKTASRRKPVTEATKRPA